MYLQEKTLLTLIFDIGVNTDWVKATQNVAQYPLHNMTYAPAKFRVAMSNSLLGGDAKNTLCALRVKDT